VPPPTHADGGARAARAIVHATIVSWNEEVEISWAEREL
jgi:hypothetical protein